MLPTNKLLPILTYYDSYNYMSTPKSDYSVEIATTNLVSYGRFPNCIFTQFIGPGLESKQVVTLSPGNEAIFAKLPDYTYKLSWKLTGEHANTEYLRFDHKSDRTAQLWRPELPTNKAYKVYSIKGDIATLRPGTGCMKLYGFSFPIVVELPVGSYLELKFELDEHLQMKDPLLSGKHCYLGYPVYNNKTGYRNKDYS